MTLDEFIAKYAGQPLDYDQRYGFQCMDLYRFYLKEVIKIPQGVGVTGAADLWELYPTQHLDRISYTPGAIPQPGDIIIWSRDTGGGYGHVGICKGGDSATFTSFDQNWPPGSFCRVITHTYKYVLGWLRPKNQPSSKEASMSNIYKGLDLSNPESMKVAVDTWYRVAKGGEELITKYDLENLREDSKELSTLSERLKGLDAQHEQEMVMLKQKHQQEIADETLKLKSLNKDLLEEISTLKDELLIQRQDWKSRFRSRKFALTAATALFDLCVATAVLFGAKPDPTALVTVLTALHTAVAVFTVPEAITDHQERMANTK